MEREAGENDELKELRSTVLYTLGYAGRDPHVRAEARRRIEKYIDADAGIDPTLSRTVVDLAALEGDSSLYERYLARARGAPTRNSDAGSSFVVDSRFSPTRR
jgi:hypothetical protein